MPTCSLLGRSVVLHAKDLDRHLWQQVLHPVCVLQQVSVLRRSRTHVLLFQQQVLELGGTKGNPSSHCQSAVLGSPNQSGIYRHLTTVIGSRMVTCPDEIQ